MKITKYLLVLAGLTLSAGCDRNSNSGGGSVNDNQPYSSSGSRSSTDTGTNAANVSGTAAQPDNTGLNARDRDSGTLTPENQGNSEADREMTRRIRQALTSDDQLSTDAKNVKVITVSGKVTLRGPVKSEEEKSRIASLAQQNGATSIDDQVEVIGGAAK
jgi:hyperosmotically inducible periplasmic protein